MNAPSARQQFSDLDLSRIYGIESALDLISTYSHDAELAHSLADDLVLGVLQVIADRSYSKRMTDPHKLARAALRVNEIEFPRWSA